MRINREFFFLYEPKKKRLKMHFNLMTKCVFGLLF
jgi:hypothetical protein